MIRIVVIDDHALVRAGFRMILDDAKDIEVVGEADNAEDGIALTRRLKPDVVLMDLNLPGMSGLEATDRLARGVDSPRIVVLTAQTQQPFPKRLLEAGATGFLTKGCPAAELVGAVRAAARNERYLSADIARLVALDALAPTTARSPFEALSPRELEIAIALAGGRTMAEIGTLLSISAKTVATYKYRVYEKTGVDSEVALANLARRYGLTDVP